MDRLLIRDAHVDDGEAIGRVHVRSWQATYAGIVPQAYLDNLDEVERGAQWRGAIEANPVREGARRLVAEFDGSIVGFAAVGADRLDDRRGELFLIYLLRESWGTGVGPELLAEATQSLVDLGHGEAVLWVAEDNARARRFYEREVTVVGRSGIREGHSRRHSQAA